MNNAISCVLCSLLLLLIEAINIPLIQSPLHSFGGALYMELYLGDPPFYLNRPLNQNLGFTVLNDHNKQSSSLMKLNDSAVLQFKYMTEDREITLTEMVDTVTFKQSLNQSLVKIVFYVSKDTSFEAYRLFGVGLGFRFLNDKLSLVHQLYESNAITHRAYSFIPPQESAAGTIWFGGIPEMNRSKGGACKVNTTSVKWSCPLSSIQFTNNNTDSIEEYINDEAEATVSFQSSRFNIEAPFHFFTFLIDKVFNGFIANNTCRVDLRTKKNYFSFSFIECNCKFIDLMPTIRLGFESFSLVIDLKLMFTEKEEGCRSPFISFDRTSWVFGTVLIGRYATLYDYDNEEVSFFEMINGFRIESGRLIEEKRLTSDKVIAVCFFWIVMLTSVIGIILSLYTLLKLK